MACSMSRRSATRPSLAASQAASRPLVPHHADQQDPLRHGGIGVDQAIRATCSHSPPPAMSFPTLLFESHDRGKILAAARPRASSSRGSVVFYSGFFTGHTSSLLIDPHRPSRVFLTDYYGTWKTNDVSSATLVVHPASWPRGSRAVLSPQSPSRGALLSGVADVDGFRHEDLVTRIPRPA